MGFAGQVFAARVAIGLAVPSPQAISKTGGLLARGIVEIGKQIELAKNRHDIGGSYQKKLAQMNSQTLGSTEKINNEILIRMKRSLEKINTETGKSLQRSASAARSSYKQLESVLSKPLAAKLTKGMVEGTGMKNVNALAANLHKMTKEQQNNVMTHLAQLNTAKDKQLQKSYEDLAVKKKISGPGGITDKEYAKQLKILKNEEKKLLRSKELLRDMKDRITLSNQLTSEYGGMSQKVKKMAGQFVGMTNQIRTGFNTALRNTIAILTAVGYKLNQSTQELMEFERELLNANSVFGLTNDKLFEVGNTIIEFGNEFGIATQNGAAGLYQLASAGLEANEAMKVLPHTLKLSMAVQGDHNTISKLTAQTIFGFGMEMSDAAEVTDKFAFAIQKSLIEYQDLSSAVKFALPFFTSTGQSLDQLLGALQILTNRALEAGIAGRGLRQALSEFAESAMDAEAGFRKMGVEILNAEGEMIQLSEIAAQFAAAVGPDTIGNTELLTILIEELNVRGATAFIHLVQASDEFTQAVEDTTNAGGQLDQMVRIQNESLSAQIQILKTNIFSIFALRDASYEGTEYINQFHEAVVQSVEGFRDLIIQGEAGSQTLTEFGQQIQDLVTEVLLKGVILIKQLIEGIKNLMPTLEALWEVLLVPLKIIAGILSNEAGLSLLKWVMGWKALKLLMIPQLLALIARGMWGVAGAMGATAGIKTAGAGYLGSGLAMAGFGGKAGTKGGAAIFSKTTGKQLFGKVATRSLAAGTARYGLGRLGLAALGPAGLAIGAAWTAYELAKMGGLVGGQAGGYLPAMAGGGRMSGNQPYLVGEQGPELFMPNTSGQLLNNIQTNNVLGGPIVLRNVSIGIDSFGGLA